MFFYLLWDFSTFVSNIFSELLILIEYFSLVFLIAFLLITLSYLLAPQQITIEKITSYECGFEPFGDARVMFDIHFYLVGLLFLIFDLEIVFLFPWVFSIYQSSFVSVINWMNIIIILFFLFLLTIGFIYEWRRHALTWVSASKK